MRLCMMYNTTYNNCMPNYHVTYIQYRNYILQITQPFQYRCTQLQYRFAVISEAPSKYLQTVIPAW